MSLYLPDAKAVFLHIPRTGGSWVEKAILASGMRYSRRRIRSTLRCGRGGQMKKHVPLPHLSTECLSQIEFAFTFVRHPLSYYEAVWRFFSAASDKGRRVMAGQKQWTWTPFSRAVIHYSPDFNEWVMKVVGREPSWVTRLYEMFVGPEGREFCAFIGRTETLADDFCEVLRHLGYGDRIDANEGELRRIPRVHATAFPRPVWNAEAREAAERTEVSAIERFYGEGSEHNKWTWLA